MTNDTSNSLSLSTEFPDGTEADWRALVEKALKGRTAETLGSRTEHGLPVKALYRETDWNSAQNPTGVPGAAPFTRGGTASKDAYLPWDIRQIVAHPDPKVARTQVMEALEHGVSSIELWVDASGEQGIAARTSADLETILTEVRLDLAPIALEAVGESAEASTALAAMLAAAIKPEDRATAQVAFNVDPISTFARIGTLPGDAQDALNNAAAFTQAVQSDFPNATVLRVDSRPVHEAGGTEVQELAYMAASGAEYMRALISQGLTANQACRAITFTVSVGSDYHLEIAKLRAARRIWSRIATSFGADGSDAAMKLQAVSSRRMLAKRDAWVNILRNTAACFAAGVGGADIVTLRNFTDAMGLPGKLARRMGRNTQIIAQEECNLGRVIDPPGGAWSFESICEETAQAAWKLFQNLEADGGVLASLVKGQFQDGIADARMERRKAVARRKEWITGVNDFPLIDELAPDVETADLSAIIATATKPSGTKPASNSWADLLNAMANGATLEDATSSSDEGAECDPLWPIRLAEPFERLRDLSDERRANGKPPRIFLAAIGPLADHSARVTFAQNFFASAGIEAVTGSGSLEDITSSFKESGAILACICGSDKQYAEDAAPTAQTLKQAGAARIYLAGRPGDAEAAYKDAGIAEFIYVGVDLLASLELAHAELGIGA